MSATTAGRALLITTILVYLALATTAAAAISGDRGSLRPLVGEAPLALESARSHRGRSEELAAQAPPPKPKDVYAYLPLLTRPNACDLNEEEAAMADLATGHPDQERETMSCHPILAQVARAHAIDMAVRDYFLSVNPEGLGPNVRVEQAGYQLPEWYDHHEDPAANNIESIAAVYPTAEAAWNSWLDGAGHQEHVLGESDFFADQTNYGIGYAFDPGSIYTHYWVFITAPPPGS